MELDSGRVDISNPSDQPGKAVLRPRVTLDRPMPKKGYRTWFSVPSHYSFKSSSTGQFQCLLEHFIYEAIDP